ncbi:MULTISPECIES: phage adaptor protein [Alphaproteobacteria]|uniref:phage adaptor protein n=1 Tax=Sphingopyxis sp. TaxID=1908224 RepID=UPI004033A858
MTIVISTDTNVRFQSYAGLKTSIGERLDREFTDADLEDFIYLAERELERVMTVPYRELVASMIITTQAMNIPADMKTIKRITLMNDPSAPLDQASMANLDRNRDWKATGRPCAFSIIGDQIWFAPAPDSEYAAQIVYEAKLTPLTEASPSNWLFSLHPDVYFYGALVQAADHITDTARIDRYRAMFDLTMGQINEEGRRRRTAASPLKLRSATVV